MKKNRLVELTYNFFDLIYVDAYHSFNGCSKDLKTWYPKVKKSKFFVGDDYRNDMVNPYVKFGVIEAVNKFAKDMDQRVYKLPHFGWALIK